MKCPEIISTKEARIVPYTPECHWSLSSMTVETLSVCFDSLLLGVMKKIHAWTYLL